MMHLCLVLALALLLPGSLAAAQQPAPTPPMGWNSWDAYGTTVREDEVRGAIDVMAADLKQFGWQYVVVDIQWSEPNPKSHGYREGAVLAMDAFGRLQPAPNRFPSAADGAGFRALAAYAHANGLKFGIHIMRGIPRQAVAANLPIEGSHYRAQQIADPHSTCAWNSDMFGVDISKPGAQAYYDSLARLYAGWGVDFIKADDMLRPYHAAEIAALHRAIQRTGRPIVLSLSPGPAPLAQRADLRRNAQMWRIADDLWDNWTSVRDMYQRMEQWAPLAQARPAQPGHWPDADMLPLGHIGLRAERGDDRQSLLTHDEQQTLMTMWCIFRSPLIFGGDLLTLDPWTRSLLTNPVALALDQHSHANRLTLTQGDLRVWTAEAANDVRYVTLFNLGDQPLPADVSRKSLGLPVGRAQRTEAWTGRTDALGDRITATLPPHGSILYRLSY